MHRSKKIILVSHCMLNYNSKVENTGVAPDVNKEVVKRLLDADIGILQLPCPELCQFGIKRWGHVREQFDTPFFRKRCKELFEPFVEQIGNYIENDYEVLGLIGINGSPSCGVDQSWSGNWGGEFGDMEAVGKAVASAGPSGFKGIFIEEIENMLSDCGISLAIKGIDESDRAFSIEQLEHLLKGEIQ